MVLPSKYHSKIQYLTIIKNIMERNIINRLNEVMSYYCISATALAKKSGIDASNLNKMLNGTQNITQQTLKKIADANNVSLDWLQTGKGEMINNTQTVGEITNSKVAGVNVHGNDIHINPDAYETLLKIVETYQGITKQFQNHIDRLITLLEKKYGE